jgi:hypothetical protein
MSIFSKIGHALFGGKANSQSTSTASPYAPVIPAVNDYIGSTQALFNGGAPQISALEQQGYDALGGMQQSGSMDAALAENQKTVSGQYLTPETNPYLADIAKRVSGGAMQSINSTFGGKGRTGSGLHEIYAGQGVGNALTDLYGQEYDRERGLQQAAVAGAPALEQGRYLLPQAQISAGQNVSARPFDIATQYGGILGNIAKLGGTTTGKNVGQAESKGIIGNAVNSFTNKLFS